MPKGPQGQKRPGDVIGAAIMVARIATGEVEESGTTPTKISSPVPERAKGAYARKSALSANARSEIARKAAAARWTAKAAPAKKVPQEP